MIIPVGAVANNDVIKKGLGLDLVLLLSPSASSFIADRNMNEGLLQLKINPRYSQTWIYLHMTRERKSRIVVSRVLNRRRHPAIDRCLLWDL